MSGYNSYALTALQGDLKDNVAMSIRIFDMLDITQGGFMTRAEAMNIQSNANPMVRLVEILRGKTDKEFDTFCDMLEKSNYPIWAFTLKRAAAGFKALTHVEGERCGIVC